MKRRNKWSFALYSLEAVMVYCLTFYGIYYVMTRVMQKPPEAGYIVLIPGIVVLSPIVILGLYMMYNRHYSDRNQERREVKSSDVNIAKSVLISMLCMGGGVICSLYAYGYLFKQPNIIVGIVFGAIAIAASIIHLPSMRRVMELFMEKFDLGQGARN